MAGTDPKLGPAFPGTGAGGKLDQLPPSARQMLGFPTTSISPGRPNSNDRPNS